MEPIVDLAPGADESILAKYFADRIRDSLHRDRNARSFMAMKATIFVIDFDTGDAVTLRFDHGRLTLHEGTIGMPSVTFGGPQRALLALDQLRVGNLVRGLVRPPTSATNLVDDDVRPAAPNPATIPPPSQRGGRVSPAATRPRASELFGMLSKGDLKIYGYWSHPRTVLRFLRLVAGPP
ncbi:MAG: hypothetical protein U0271_24600 [Polyangiaceae bacterium]